jgi:hypothetical protein
METLPTEVRANFNPATMFTGKGIQISYASDLSDGIGFDNRRLSDECVARLAGAVDYSSVAVTLETTRIVIKGMLESAQAVVLKATNPVVFANPTERHLYKDESGQATIAIISNENFQLQPEFRQMGIGTYALAFQVKAALEAGISRLVANAAGRKDSEYSGYVVWPQLGYDGLIPDDIWTQKLPADGIAALGLNPETPVLISELLRCGGISLWKEYGEGYIMHFDVDASRPMVRKLLAMIDGGSK